jgi:hypothetical protein
MIRGLIVGALLLTLASPALAQVDNTIGIFLPTDCATGETVTHPGTPLMLSVCLVMNGYRPYPTEISGTYAAVQLRLAGFPEGWDVEAVPDPDAASVSGDPLAAEGGELIVPLGEGSSVPLYALTIHPRSTENPVTLNVTGVRTECPRFRWIGAAVDGAPLCAKDGPFMVTVEPLLPVEPITWSRLKARFGGHLVSQRPSPR